MRRTNSQKSAKNSDKLHNTHLDHEQDTSEALERRTRIVANSDTHNMAATLDLAHIPPELLEHLENTLSYNAQARETALAWLQQYQTQRGFQLCLVEVVAARRQLSVPVRTQAALFFKNSIDKYWRRGQKA